MKKLIAWVLATFLATTAFPGIAQELSIEEEQRAIDKQTKVISEILRLYNNFALERPPDISKCIQEMIAMRRLGQCRDKFSRYVSPEEAELDKETADGEFEGIGLEVTERETVWW